MLEDFLSSSLKTKIAFETGQNSCIFFGFLLIYDNLKKEIRLYNK